MSECYILTLPEPRTTGYGLESIKYEYEAVKYWHSLSDSIRTMTSLKDFKKAIIKETRTLRILITFNYFT